MIEGYVGLIGGGKSYNATLRMLEYMASGGVVYTNMTLIRTPWYNLRYASSMKEFKLSQIPFGVSREINKEQYIFINDLCIARLHKGKAYANSCGYEYHLKKRYKWQYQPGQYNRLSNEALTGELHALIPKGTPDKPVLCVLDEAVDFFDTDDRGKANRAFLSFLRHSRKQSVDMIFIAQDYTELNKRIRNQTHFIWTFWDMQTFRVPGVRCRLPPPWRNFILCQQWNRNMTGGILKRIWRVRDTEIFGCYRTDELFRDLKSAEGKTDYGSEGKINQKGKKMNLLERAALFMCVFFTVLDFFSGNPPANAQNTTSQPEKKSKSQKGSSNISRGTITVLYAKFSYWTNTEYIGDEIVSTESEISVDGIRYAPGQLTPSGTVLAASASHIHIRDDFGNDTFIYPRAQGWNEEEEKAAPRPESVSQTSQDD